MYVDVTSIIQVAGLLFLSIFGTPEIFCRDKEAIMHPISSLLDQELSLTQLVDPQCPTTQFNAS